MPVRPFTPEEIHAERRKLEVPLFGTVLLSAAMFGYAEGSVFFVVAALLAVGVHWVATCRNTEIFARRLVLNAGVALVGVVLLVRFFTTDQELLIALGHYVTLIQLCKLFERKGDRDYVQMLVMSMLLVLAGAMICQELLFAIMGLMYVAFLSYTAMVLTIKRSLLSAARSRGGPVPPGAGGHWPRWALWSRLAVVLTALLATGVVVFLISPREAGGSARTLRRTGRARSGFAETVRLGQPRRIYLSDRVVMYVGRYDPAGRAVGAGGGLYLRGRVFDEYVDSRWVKPIRSRRLSAIQAPGDILARTVREEVSMVPSLLPVAFASYPAVNVTSPDATVRRLDELEYELRASPRLDRPIHYTAYVLPGALSARERQYVAHMRGRRSRSLEAHRVEAAPRVVSLARRWCTDLLARHRSAGNAAARGPLDLAIARRIAGRLKQRCRYTLDLSGADPDRDGVEDFLFSLRRGHCEYFASALTVMCRALDVRARLATGFRPSEYDAASRRHVVRERSAHAWTEVYTPQTDWTVVDATPGERFEPAPQTAWGRWLSGLTNTWTSWEFAWYEKVIGYDDDTRRELAGRVRGALRAAWRAVVAALADAAAGAGELLTRGRLTAAAAWLLGVVAAAAALAGGAVLLVRRRRRRKRPAQVRPGRQPAFFVQLLRLLRRHGLSARPSQTARELAREAAERFDLPDRTLHELVGLYYRIRWSHESAGGDELQAAEARVRRLAEMLST